MLAVGSRSAYPYRERAVEPGVALVAGLEARRDLQHAADVVPEVGDIDVGAVVRSQMKANVEGRRPVRTERHPIGARHALGHRGTDPWPLEPDLADRADGAVPGRAGRRTSSQAIAR